MPAYHFKAMNAAGIQHQGVIEAENEKQARTLLRKQSLLPFFVQKVDGHVVHRRYSLNTKTLALITRQLATLLAVGLPIGEALSAVADQSERSSIKGLLLAVRGKVMAGHAFASALQDHPQAFPTLYWATIAAGEKSGHLDQVLLQLADYAEKQYHSQQQLKTACIYPMMIVLTASSIVCFLLAYVVPKMIVVYSHMNQTLPLLTLILISISSLLQHDGLYLLLLVTCIFFGMRYVFNRNQIFQRKIHYSLLRMPLIAYAIKTSDTARFARTLSILSRAGISVLEAMTIAAQLIHMIPIREAVLTTVNRVREGASLHLALKQTTYFPVMSPHMIASGEASGQLEAMLDRIAMQQEEEMARWIASCLALFEPAVILVMGVIVLFIVLAVLLPIFQLNQFTQ